MIVAAFGVIPATVGALLQEVVDLVTILAALRAIGGRLDAKALAGDARPGWFPDRGCGTAASAR